jgi:zinc transport system substrate-binding protein
VVDTGSYAAYRAQIRIILNTRLKSLGVVTAALCVSFAGCGERATETGARIEVAASFYPLAEVARRVGGEEVAVSDLTPAGAEPHDIELRPQDVERIEQADMAVVMGGGFQPAVEEAAERSGVATVEVLDAVAPGDNDPHVWLDPVLMGQVATAVADGLARVDAAASATYRANAEAFRAEMAALHEDFRAGLAGCRRRLLVTAHDAFGHLARRYGLESESIAGIAPDAEPDPRRLAQLVDLVKTRGVTTVFTEELVSPEVAETLAREAGVGTAVLNPVEGLTSEQARSGMDYAALMRANLQQLRTGLSCQ